MADKELRKLNRRELLRMLLIQCEETERLQRELNEITSEHEVMSESYERLKNKLNVKDERLNQKDAQITALKTTIEEMKLDKTIELTEAGNIAEAALRLNGIFEMAQQAAEQYLMNVKRYAEVQPQRAVMQPVEEDIGESEKRIPFESGWRAGIRRRTGTPRSRQGKGTDSGRITNDEADYHRIPAASGDIHG